MKEKGRHCFLGCKPTLGGGGSSSSEEFEEFEEFEVSDPWQMNFHKQSPKRFETSILKLRLDVARPSLMVQEKKHAI